MVNSSGEQFRWYNRPRMGIGDLSEKYVHLEEIRLTTSPRMEFVLAVGCHNFHGD